MSFSKLTYLRFDSESFISELISMEKTHGIVCCQDNILRDRIAGKIQQGLKTKDFTLYCFFPWEVTAETITDRLANLSLFSQQEAYIFMDVHMLSSDLRKLLQRQLQLAEHPLVVLTSKNVKFSCCLKGDKYQSTGHYFDIASLANWHAFDLWKTFIQEMDKSCKPSDRFSLFFQNHEMTTADIYYLAQQFVIHSALPNGLTYFDSLLKDLFGNRFQLLQLLSENKSRFIGKLIREYDLGGSQHLLSLVVFIKSALITSLELAEKNAQQPSGQKFNRYQQGLLKTFKLLGKGQLMLFIKELSVWEIKAKKQDQSLLIDMQLLQYKMQGMKNTFKVTEMSV